MNSVVSDAAARCSGLSPSKVSCGTAILAAGRCAGLLRLCGRRLAARGARGGLPRAAPAPNARQGLCSCVRMLSNDPQVHQYQFQATAWGHWACR